MTHYVVFSCTVWHKILKGEVLMDLNFSNSSKFYHSEFSSISCLHVRLIQFFKISLVKYFVTPNTSKFSTVKILRYTVCMYRCYYTQQKRYTNMEKVDHRGVPVATEYLIGKMEHPVNRHQYFTPLDWVI